MPRLPAFLHAFEGKNARCAIKTCQLGRAAAVHRKPRDFPEVRLEVAEQDVKRLKAGFKYAVERLELYEEIIRLMLPCLGATVSQGGKVQDAREKAGKKLAAFAEKYAPKAPSGG